MGSLKLYVVKMRSSGWAMIQYDYILMKGRTVDTGTDVHTGRRPCVDEGKDLGDTVQVKDTTDGQ